ASLLGLSTRTGRACSALSSCRTCNDEHRPELQPLHQCHVKRRPNTRHYPGELFATADRVRRKRMRLKDFDYATTGAYFAGSIQRGTQGAYGNADISTESSETIRN